MSGDEYKVLDQYLNITLTYFFDTVTSLNFQLYQCRLLSGSVPEKTPP